MRSDESSWASLAFAPTGEGSTWKDENFPARFRVAISLQYDLRPSDLELLKYLVEQETMSHVHSPFQGLTESLQILGWLLAEERCVGNTPLFLRAKFANFDTYCGFDVEHVFSAGYEETVAFLREQAAEGSAEEEFLNNYKLSEHAIERWFKKQRKRFPSNPEQESHKTRVQRNFHLGDLEAAHRALTEWERESDRNLNDLTTFLHWYRELGDRGRAITLCYEILGFEMPQSYRSSQKLTLIRLLREERQTELAWPLILELAKVAEVEEDKSNLPSLLLAEVWELALVAHPCDLPFLQIGHKLEMLSWPVPAAVEEMGELVAAFYSESDESSPA